MLSHQIAVNAYLVADEKFLILKRTDAPFLWGPPGGRLRRNEDPIKGLQREVFEETRLQIKVIQPITTWFGFFNQEQLLSIDYLSYTQDIEVHLSKEHSQYGWFSVDEVYEDRSFLFAHETGFQLSDFMRAWVLNLCLNGKLQKLAQVYKNKSFRKYLPNQN